MDLLQSKNLVVTEGSKRADESRLDTLLRTPPAAEYFLWELVRTDAYRNSLDRQLFRRGVSFESVKSAPGAPAGLGEIRELTEERFYELYDKTLPAIAFVSGSAIDGCFLIGVASALERKRRSANVILLPSFKFPVLLSEKTAEGHILFATEGGLFDSNGVLHIGRFPVPAPICLFDHANAEPVLTELYRSRELPMLISTKAVQDLRDKVTGKEVIRNRGMHVPDGLPLYVEERTEMPSAIKMFLEEHACKYGVVLKPLTLWGGKGVKILSAEDVDHIVSSALELQDKHGSLLLEERIQSIPIYRDGVQLDWNLRVLGSPRGIIDWEVRINADGGPINKCLGASIEEFTIDFLAEALGDRELAKQLFDDVRARINTFCRRMCNATDSSFLGHDIILSPPVMAPKPYIPLTCIETNAGSIGGLQSLAEIRETFEDKIRAPKKFLEHMTASTTGLYARYLEITEPIKAGPVGRSRYLSRIDMAARLDEIIYGTLDTSLYESTILAASTLVKDLSPEELESTSPETLATVYYFGSMALTYAEPANPATLQFVERALMLNGDSAELLYAKLGACMLQAKWQEFVDAGLRFARQDPLDATMFLPLLVKLANVSPYLTNFIFEAWKEVSAEEVQLAIEAAAHYSRGDFESAGKSCYALREALIESGGPPEEIAEATVKFAELLYAAERLDEVRRNKAIILEALENRALSPEALHNLHQVLLYATASSGGIEEAEQLAATIEAHPNFNRRTVWESDLLPLNPLLNSRRRQVIRESMEASEREIAGLLALKGDALSHEELVDAIVRTTIPALRGERIVHDIEEMGEQRAWT